MTITVPNATMFGKKVAATIQISEGEMRVAIAKEILSVHGLVVRPESINFSYTHDYEESSISGATAQIEVEIKQVPGK